MIKDGPLNEITENHCEHIFSFFFLLLEQGIDPFHKIASIKRACGETDIFIVIF
jgi:hypothetical protein